MTRVAWNTFGSRGYEVGVDRGVLYPERGHGVAWNGLVSVRENPGTPIHTVRYFDGEKYHNAEVADSFAGTITAITYPPDLDGDIFGLCYRTLSPTDENPDGYKLHLVYNVTVEPRERAYISLGGDIEVEPFSWSFITEPLQFLGLRPTAHIIVDATKAYSWVVEAFENIVYGDAFDEPRLPTPDEVLELFESGSILRVTDHGDGTWTATGPDEAIQMVNDHVFQITWPSAVIIDHVSWTISSL